MRLRNSLIGILALATFVACDSGTDPDPEEQFSATLTGGSEVPPFTTDATGEAEFVHDVEDAELSFVLSVDDLANARAAHIHLGAAGANGPVIAFLFTSDTPVTVTAPTVLSTGVITADEVIAVEGFDGTFAALIAQMKAGNTYVNVHTVAKPGGEIRGQIAMDP